MAKSKVVFYGYNPPFVGGPQNILSRQEDDRLIKNDLLQLLLTVPGERVMRPDFGVPLRTFVFEQLVDGDITALDEAITTAITTFEPRVNIVDLQLVRDDVRHGLNITLVVSLVRDQQHVLTIETFLAGAT